MSQSIQGRSRPNKLLFLMFYIESLFLNQGGPVTRSVTKTLSDRPLGQIAFFGGKVLGY